MNEKRRDSKGRILHNGEVQRPDGRYRYKYYDSLGKDHYLYSWRLNASDPTPPSKKRDISLREQINRVQADKYNHIMPLGGNLTVVDLVERYVATRTGVRTSTKAGYKTTINFLNKDRFGEKRIDTVGTMDAKLWIIKLQQQDHKSFSAIHSIRGVLRPAFQMAYEDDLIRKNPFSFELASVLVNDSVTREALTREQERKFLQFIENDQHFSKYYDGIFILFQTGLRISEFVGLTKKDVDFKNHKLTVDHQLMRASNMKYYIEKTKTESGNRQIPIGEEVEAAFKRILHMRRTPKVEPMVDGYMGFLYLDKNNMPMVALHWEKYFQHIREKYNKIYKVQMPKVTPHVCRHTYCSKMAKTGMNPKTLQYIMGHSDISVTLNTYTHVNYEDAVEELKRVNLL